MSQDKKSVSTSYPLGEHAHIVAKEQNGPRGDSRLPQEQRDSYSNLILLCPTDHSRIDKNPEDFPVELLYVRKSEHELWVQQTLAEASDPRERVQHLVYAHLIDTAVEAARLYEWSSWTSMAFSTDPTWFGDAPDRAFAFVQKVGSAVWPGELEELERSIQTLAITLHEAATTFKENAEWDSGYWRGVRFYRIREYDPESYHRLLSQYNAWVKECYELLYETAKAANWFASVVRRDLNPMFFALEGKFLVTEGPFEDFSIRSSLLEYKQAETADLPGTFVKRRAEQKKWNDTAT